MSSQFDPDDPKVLEEVKKAAVAHTDRSMRSKQAARRTLINEGILTKSGHISKRYNKKTAAD